jgi:DNA-binding CsgD family transcriptional regulator
MENTLELFAEAAHEAGELGELETLTSRTLQGLGFSVFMMSARLPAGIGDLFGPCDCSHMQRYRAERLHLVDPVARAVDSSWVPVIWDFRDYIRSDERRCAELFERSAEVGYERGISTPIHGPRGRNMVLASIYGGGFASLRASERSLGNMLMILGLHVARAHHRLTVRPAAPRGPALTVRERECLTWSSRGKTAWEVSRIIGVAERTVNFHLQNAMAKLDTSSKHQAYLRAVDLNLIES